MSERTLPHDLDAEKAVLGSVLISVKAWPIAMSVLRDDEFFRDAHRRIFEAFGRMSAAGTAPDLLTVCDELRRLGQLEQVGGPAYISSLTEGVPVSTNVEHYARIVREKAALREIIARSSEAMSSAYDAERRASEIVEAAMRGLTDAQVIAGGGFVLARDAVADYGARLATGTLPMPIPTGLIDIDRLVDGLRPGDFVIIAGRPSSGKTALGLGIADRMAHAGTVSGFFSLEMRQQLIAAELLGWWSGTPMRDAERGTASEEQYQQIRRVLDTLDDRQLYIETESRNATEIWGWCKRMKQQRGLKVAFVDYLQLLAGSEESEVAQVSRTLKTIAKDLDIVVVALSQLKRAQGGRADKRPILSDLKGSGALEQDTDLALLIYRAEMHKLTDENKGVAEVIVAKNRTGRTGVVKLTFISERARFENMARVEEEPS